jgi:hypothetical protein
LAIAGLALLIVVPLALSRIRESQLRAAAAEFGVVLRAARMVAVGTGRPRIVEVEVDPVNAYRYVDATGREREFRLPAGLRIVASPATLEFLPNGALAGAPPVVTVLEARLAGGVVERWTVTTGAGGIPKVSHETVPPQS